MIKNILLILTISISIVHAQKIDMNLLNDLAPRSVGPAGMSGRVTSIDVVENDPSIIFIGTASGGVWKSESGGTSWEPVFDDQKLINIGSVAIQQSNPDVIWVGTGEGNPRNSMNSGYGIYKSLDGGKSWKLMGLEKTRLIHRIIIDPVNPNLVYVGTLGTAWGKNTERGVYKTTDGGKSWEKILYVNEKTGCADLVIDPTNPNKLLAAMWEYRRWPYYFNSGGPGSGLYISLDGGETWNRKTSRNGLPEGNLGRIGLAIAPGKPEIVYALIEAKKNALYKSVDGGDNWKMINDKEEIGNRPFYYSDLYVDPKNENRVYSLYSLVSRSEDGGKSFDVIMPYYGSTSVHPDHHAWYIHPDNPDFMINGNDGGMAITRDGGETWRFVENLPLAQFYHISVDNLFPYNIYGGMQDNGSWRGPAFVFRAGGIRNGYWEELYFGDGFDVVPDPEYPERYGYAMSQGGNVGRYDLKTHEAEFIKPVHPKGEKLRFNWNAGIAQDPFDPSTIYYGSQYLHKSTDRGKTWSIISPDLTTNDTEKQKQNESGGLTIDDTNAENYTTIVSIAPSPVDQNIIWVGTDDGNVQVTRDGGKSWNNLISKIKEAPENGWVCQIQPSQQNAGEAFVVMNNYRQDDWNPYLFHTEDYGKSWTSMVSESSIWGYTLSFWQDIKQPKLMFLGTEHGLYVSFDKGGNWNKWTKGYPSASTMDIAYQESEDDLVLGTFGRAAYVFDNLQPLREIAEAEGLNTEFDVYDGGTGYLIGYGQATGTRFAANAIFQGKNRPYGVPITFYINNNDHEEKENDENEDKTKKAKKDNVKVYIKNGNDTIRTFNYTPDSSGIHVTYWNMTQKGEPSPTRRKRSDDYEPGGPSVMPGNYNAIVQYGDYTDSTMVEVKSDPRIEFDVTTQQALRNHQMKIERLSGAAAQAVEQLLEGKKSIDKILGQFPEEKDSVLTSLEKDAKIVKDSLESIVELFIGKENVKGIQRNPDEISAVIGNASRYARSATKVNPTVELTYQQAAAAVKKGIELVNDYMKGDFQLLKARLLHVELEYFKSFEEIKLD